jgi:Flp pilus assembly pilin Flp
MFSQRVVELQNRGAGDERGALMVEYGMLLLAVFAVAIMAVTTFGSAVVETFTGAQSEFGEINANLASLES